MDHYEVLGVSRTAPANVIRAAAKALSREHHPDRGGSSDPEIMQLINAAHDVLLDEDRRRAYDRTLRSAEDAPAPAEPEPAPEAQWGTEETIPPERPEPTASPPPRFAPPPPTGPQHGPGATPLDTAPRPYAFDTPPPAPPTWGPVAGPPAGSRVSRESAWAILNADTPVARISGFVWVVLTALLPVAVLVAAALGQLDGLASNLVLAGLMVLVPAGGAIARVRTGRLSKRYLGFSLFTLFYLVSAPVDTVERIVVATWLVSYVLAVESRLRRW